MSKILTFSFAVLSTIAAFALNAEAQFVGTLGQSSLTGQRFDCVTYPKGEDIVIVERNGKSRKVSKKKAGENIDGSLQRASRRIAGFKSALKAKRARIQKLLNSPTLALPSVGEELERLKQEVPKLEAALQTATTEKTELKFLKAAIGKCGKEPPPIVGSNIIVQYSIHLPKTNKEAFGIHAVHAFAVPAGVPARICASVNGGPYYEVGIQYSVGTTFYDGNGTSNPVSHAEPAPLGVGYLPIFGKASYFNLGYYEDYLTEVQSYLSYSFKLFIPTAKKNCPRA